MSRAPSPTSPGSSTRRWRTAPGPGSRPAAAMCAVGSSTTARGTARPCGARCPCAATEPRRRRIELGAADPAGADEARAVPPGELLDAHPRAGVRRVDEATVADVDPDVADSVEEDEVAGAERRARDATAAVEVAVGRVRERDAEVPVDEPDEAGAVEARARGAAAVDIADAPEALRVGDDSHAEHRPGLRRARGCGLARGTGGAPRKRLHECVDERAHDGEQRKEAADVRHGEALRQEGGHSRSE